MMNAKDLQLTVPDGTVDAVLFTPEDGRPLPGVLFIPDIGSIRDTMRQMALRLAGEGYTILMPNPFYRTSRPPVFSFPRKSGDPATVKRIQELAAPLTPEALERDLTVYLETLASQPTTAKGKVGTVGFCIGGGIALRAAAIRPDRVGAAASFHGGGLYSGRDNPRSPHQVLPRVRASLYFGHATDDKSMDADAIAHFERALQTWGGHFESETYNAHHGWTVPDNPAYQQPEAERAWGKLTTLFRETLS
jgi:carboxymethylenebutenolidase